MIVAFDGDDTLWHNEDQFQEVQQTFAALLSEWASADEVEAALLEVERRNLRRYGYGAKSFMLSMTETALELSDHEADAATVKEIIDLGHSILDRPIQLLDDVIEVLDALQHLTLMLITKGDLYAQHARIAESGLSDRFWRVEVVAEKNPATYAGLLDRHEIAVERFVMVGNSLRSDVLPVIELGGRGVHVPYHVTWAMETADSDEADAVPTLHRLGELPGLIEEWA